MVGVPAPEGIVQGYIQLIHQLLLRRRALVVVGQKRYRHGVFLALHSSIGAIAGSCNSSRSSLSYVLVTAPA